VIYDEDRLSSYMNLKHLAGYLDHVRARRVKCLRSGQMIPLKLLFPDEWHVFK
jgi:hypothetical protein